MEGQDNAMEHIYEVSRVNIAFYGPRYYRDAVCREERIALCSTLERSEAIIARDIEEYASLEPAHSYFVRYLQVDRPVDDYQADAEFVYDCHGKLQGQWNRPLDHDIVLVDESECRFRPGDICEVLWADMRPHPAIISQLPPDGEALAAKSYDIASEGAYRVLIVDETGTCRDLFVNMLHVYEPREKIHPSTVRKLRRELLEFRTLPVRKAIGRTAHEHRLLAITESLGLEARVLQEYSWEEESLLLGLDAAQLPGYDGPCKEDLTIKVWYSQIDKHPDVIREGLRRLMGLPREGRGYRLKEDPLIDVPGVEVNYHF